jgi:ABC-type tungstate transport system permease subunit
MPWKCLLAPEEYKDENFRNADKTTKWSVEQAALQQVDQRKSKGKQLQLLYLGWQKTPS